MLKRVYRITILSFLLYFVCITQAQTGAPPQNNGNVPRACLNVYVPGIIINILDALLIAPEDVPPLENIGEITRIQADADESGVVSVMQVNFDMDVNDNRGDVCFFFEFEGFADEDEDASRVIRIEQADVNQDFEDEETDCELDSSDIPNASFTLDIYEDESDDDDPLDDDDLLTDFSGEDEDSEEPILLITNLSDVQPFEIELSFCDESPEDDPDTDEDESDEDPEFEEIPTLQDYCDDAEVAIEESDNPDEELPEICGELIRLPQNRQIFVITDTDGYFNYSADR
jgi:hypothetical protein